MNQKNNQAYQNTHRKIKDCVLQSIQKKELSLITVSGLCAMAQINRSTFYAHFDDIYDVVSQIKDDLEKELLEMYREAEIQGTSASIVREYLLILLSHISMHRRFYQVLLHDLNNPVMQNLLRLLKEQIIQPLFDELSISISEGAYYFNFAVSGFIAVIRQWLDAGCPESPDQLSDILFEMMPIRSDATLGKDFHFQDTRN